MATASTPSSSTSLTLTRAKGSPTTSALTRFRQGFAGEGSYLHEIDQSVLGLPLTLLSTNVNQPG